ncbi:NHL repeat-containing protein [Kaarinaea lacus]
MTLSKLIKQAVLILVFLLYFAAVSAAPEFVRASAEIFAHPHDLELDPTGRWVFIADVNHHDVKVVDAKTLELVKVIGEGELDSPHDVHFDQEGRLLVADSGNDRIAIYEVNGLEAKFTGELGNGMSSPEGVTSAPGGFIFVASTGNHKILKFHNNRLVKKVGGRGDGKLEFVRPHDIELGSDGLLYIGDPGNHRIQVLSSFLTYNKTIEQRKQQFDEPKYLALDKNNWLYIADQHNNQLRIFNDKRKEVAAITQAGEQRLNYIEGVEVYDGMIWISDTYNDRVVLFHWTPQ